MNFIITGLNHKTADITLREKLAFTPEQIPDALHSIANQFDSLEVVILSTCNRTEIYAACPKESSPHLMIQNLQLWLCQYHSLSIETFKQHAYDYQSDQALTHMIKVAIGIDSMVVGESQVLGQIKSAYTKAQEVGTVFNYLDQIFQYVFRCAKRIRTETQIGFHPTSFANAAVKLAQHIFTNLSGCNLLLIGAGELIESVAKPFFDKGIKNITIANRTLSRAQSLAKKFNGKGVLLADIPNHLLDCDIVVACTASQLPILGKGAVESALKQRKHKPIFMLDLAVPRDIEPEVNELADIYLYAIDDLQQMIDDNQKFRNLAAKQSNDLIKQAVLSFPLSHTTTETTLLIKQYRAKIMALSESELLKAKYQLNQDVSPEQVLLQLTRNLTQKLLHDPSIALKKSALNLSQEHDLKLQWFKEIFNLKDDESNS